MSEQRVVLGRDELYELVWTEPVRRIAKRHGISDVALAKACRKLRIPLPKRGHWAKGAAGHKVKRRALPPLKDGQPSQYRTRIHVTTLAPEIAMTLEKELAPEQRIRVADELVSPHPLVAEAGALLAKAKPNKEGLVARGDRRCLDVHVSPALLDRALRILDALLKALEQRGHSIETTV